MCSKVGLESLFSQLRIHEAQTSVLERFVRELMVEDKCESRSRLIAERTVATHVPH